jgi:hypothetical protein
LFTREDKRAMQEQPKQRTYHHTHCSARELERSVVDTEMIASVRNRILMRKEKTRDLVYKEERKYQIR